MSLLKINIHFIDVGTCGLSGNIESIITYSQKYSSLCCRKVQNEVLPICTLRNNPKKYEHCVVFATEWVKHVIYGQDNELNDINQINQCISQDQIKEYTKTFLNQNYEINYHETDIISIYDQLNINNSYSTFQKILSQNQYFDQLNIQQGYNKDNFISQILLSCIAYLRSISFNIIPDTTPFKTQQIANKIIPAISFSNGLSANISCQLLDNNQNQSVFITNSMRLNNLIIFDKQQEKSQECQFCDQKMIVINKDDKNKISQILEQPIYIFKTLDQNNSSLLVTIDNQQSDSGWDDDQDENQQKQQYDLNILQENIIYRSICGQNGQIIYFSILNDQKTQVLQNHQNYNQQEQQSIDITDSISIL